MPIKTEYICSLCGDSWLPDWNTTHCNFAEIGIYMHIDKCTGNLKEAHAMELCYKCANQLFDACKAKIDEMKKPS